MCQTYDCSSVRVLQQKGMFFDRSSYFFGGGGFIFCVAHRSSPIMPRTLRSNPLLNTGRENNPMDHLGGHSLVLWKFCLYGHTFLQGSPLNVCQNVNIEDTQLLSQLTIYKYVPHFENT